MAKPSQEPTGPRGRDYYTIYGRLVTNFCGWAGSHHVLDGAVEAFIVYCDTNQERRIEMEKVQVAKLNDEFSYLVRGQNSVWAWMNEKKWAGLQKHMAASKSWASLTQD